MDIAVQFIRKTSKMNFMGHTAELMMSSDRNDQQEAQSLFIDWQRGRSRMWAEAVSKFTHYQQLPHKLLQLAHPSAAKAAAGAKACLYLWQQGGPGCLHRQSRRFLDPSWPSSVSDPSLRELVIRVANGEQVTSSEDFHPLIKWISRFSTIRLAERSVESIHSLTTKMLKRAPHAALPYISLELRFKSFWSTILQQPSVT